MPSPRVKQTSLERVSGAPSPPFPDKLLQMRHETRQIHARNDVLHVLEARRVLDEGPETIWPGTAHNFPGIRKLSILYLLLTYHVDVR